MTYKFENREVWQRSLEYADKIHEIADQRPKHERYNLVGMGRRTVDGGSQNASLREYR